MIPRNLGKYRKYANNKFINDRIGFETIQPENLLWGNKGRGNHGKFEKTNIMLPQGFVENTKTGYILDGRLNKSYSAVNSLLQESIPVHRILDPVGEIPKGAFYIPYQEDTEIRIREIAEKQKIKFQCIESEKLNTKTLQTQKVGVYQRYRGGNMDEGWLRWVLEQHNFGFKTIMDEEIKTGDLAKTYDVIIIPSDDRRMIIGKEKDIQEYYKKSRPKSIPPKYPPEYQSGIGDEGIKKLKEFTESGGTLITIGKSCSLALEDLKLPINNVLKDVKSKDEESEKKGSSGDSSKEE